NYHAGAYLGTFVAGHGVLELTAIFIAGGAGFRLAGALVAPGDLARKDALVLAGRIAARMIGAVAPVPPLPGTTEGLLPTSAPAGSTAGGAAGSLVQSLQDLAHFAGEALDLLQAPDRLCVEAINVEEQQLGFRQDRRQRVRQVVPERTQRVTGLGHHSKER